MNDWIKIEDELPEVTGDVLASDGERVDRVSYVAYNFGGGGNFSRNWFKVKYWMPMPLPPKGDK